MPDTVEAGVAVELYLRSAAPSVTQGRQAAVRDRVDELARTGRVSEASVDYWSTRVCTPGGTAGPGERCPRVVGEILAAAADDRVAVEPYFRRAERGRPGADDVLFLPVMCLVVRRDGALCGLYPATCGGERYTVEDGLARLEAGEDAANLPSDVGE